jgi:Major tropism determinant N-terminal domain
MSVIQTQRGTAAALTATNPVITDGQIVYETDTGRFKVGDGSTAWASLAYQGTNASYLTTGTIPDARHSSAIATYATLASNASSSTSVIDIYPRGEQSGQGTVMASGTLWITFFTPSVTLTVSSITMGSTQTAAASLTLARMGLYTFDETTATLVARTASDTTLFTSTLTTYQRSFSSVGGFPASYTCVSGSRYGIGVIVIGTTMPSIGIRPVNISIAALTPRMSGTLASQSDLPTSASITACMQSHPWARLS